jgi:hypothetical protein
MKVGFLRNPARSSPDLDPARGIERERESERERERETESERARERETERQRDRETERQRGRERARERDRETEKTAWHFDNMNRLDPQSGGSFNFVCFEQSKSLLQRAIPVIVKRVCSNVHCQKPVRLSFPQVDIINFPAELMRGACSDPKGGQRKHGIFCTITSGVRLWWELKEPAGPKYN